MPGSYPRIACEWDGGTTKQMPGDVAVITGATGLIGSEAARFFGSLGMKIVGIDNDMRSYFFGSGASTQWTMESLKAALGENYEHHAVDVRDEPAIKRIFEKYAGDIALVVHTAAQPSHDWAAQEPLTDFTVNALGTLQVLEATRAHAPRAVFIFTSTNKVYGDRPNTLPYVELGTRYELPEGHEWFRGIPESMSIDTCLHSVFGASKVAADVMVQEYGRYFGMKTVCFRGGTLTGPAHSAVELHGFLAYLMKCTMMAKPYSVFGYKAKQVRDVIHSTDLIQAFYEFFRAPRPGEVYNMGGGRSSNCSVIEAIAACEGKAGRKLDWKYTEQNRIGDHIWWIGDLAKFEEHYPNWKIRYNVDAILDDMVQSNRDRWKPQ